MCTLIALYRRVAGCPLVVAANRDEFHDRPAEGPALRGTPGGVVLSPRDKRAGGTWLGLNSKGLFAALTNRRCEDPDPACRSRGHLVMEALAAASAHEAARSFEDLAVDAYNPFNLFVADSRSAHVVSLGERVERFDLAPGAHVIGNAHPGDRCHPKIARLAGEAEQAAQAPADRVLDELAEVCRRHVDGDPFAATCVHAGAYGTRSSLLLRTSERDGGELRFAGGAPCVTPYDDFTPLLHELGAFGPRAGDHTVRKAR